MAVKTEVLLRILKSASIQEVQLRLIDIANQWAAAVHSPRFRTPPVSSRTVAFRESGWRP
jgi:hypothetical protein